jgi:replicative DNA helicase
LLEAAVVRVREEHFTDQTNRNLWVMLTRYYEVAGSVMTRAALSDLLRQSGQVAFGTAQLYEEVYDTLAERQVDEAGFRWAVEQLRDVAATTATGDVLAQGMEILRSGAKGARGARLFGHVDAREHVLAGFATIDRELFAVTAPEGNVRDEASEILSEYATRKADRLAGRTQGPMCGIPEIDSKTGGLQRGEINLMCGYTSSGKTAWCVQLTWHTAVRQGLNVVYFTSETLRNQVRQRLISRHSREPQFGLPEGINSHDLKAGTLPESLEPALRDVVSDLASNPAYGNVHIAQMPKRCTVQVLEARLIAITRKFRADLVVIDSLNLLYSDARRQSDRELLGTILKDAQSLATTYADGYGVPIVSPWQVNRTAREQALRLGYYTLQSPAESAEASQTPAVVMSILEPEEPGRKAELKMQILKNRDGEKLSSIIVDADYANAYFQARTTSSAMDSLLDEGSLEVGL